MELRQVSYFVMVAEMGNFLRAAEELYISQSSLSKQIIALEKELDCTLFDRSRRKIVLTPAGETFLGYARHLLQSYQSMLSGMAQYRITPTVNIVSIPVIAQYGIPAYLTQFKQAFPAIQLALEEREAAAVLSALDNHQCDLAILRDAYLDNTLYDWLQLSCDKFLVILSRQHRFAARQVLALTDLVSENFIMFNKGTVVHELAVEACRDAGFEPSIFYASLRVESVLGLVASNAGIALMMEKVYTYHQNPQTVAIPLTETVGSRLVLAWLKGTELSRPARMFAEFVEKIVIAERGE